MLKVILEKLFSKQYLEKKENVIPLSLGFLLKPHLRNPRVNAWTSVVQLQSANAFITPSQVI